MVDGNDWCPVMFVVSGTGIVNEKLCVFVRAADWTLMCLIVSNRDDLFPVKHMFERITY